MFYFIHRKIIIVLAIITMIFLYLLVEFQPLNVGREQQNNLVHDSSSTISGLKGRRSNSSVYVQRRAVLQRVCKTKPYSQKWKLKTTKRKYLLYSKPNNFVFCFVQKIGCTFWKRIFLALEQKEIKNMTNLSGVHKLELPTLYRLSDREVKAFVRSTLSVLFVRDPYSRLLSGYIDKFLFPNPHYWGSYGTRIIRRYRKNPSNESLACGHDVTFAEFVEYVIDTYSENQRMLDNHFTPIHQHCRPCEIDYKIIGKMETFEDDVNYVLNELPNFTANNRPGRLNLTEELMQIVLDQTRHKSCLNQSETSKRILKSLHYRGIIDYNKISYAQFSEVLKPMTLSNVGQIANILSSKPTRTEKRANMVEYYIHLSKPLLGRVGAFLKPDCKLFGYDDRPKDIFIS